MNIMSLGWLKRKAVQAERLVGSRLLAAPYDRGSRKMLFVIGHMRTGSSLFVHLLASHHNILGYGETHIAYSSASDFGATTANICRRLRTFPFGKSYVLDKILHKRLIAHKEVLEHPAVRIIFIVRRPDMALSSMVRSEAVSRAEEAYRHYVQQVEWVHQLSQHVPPEQWTSTTYSELIQGTSVVFGRIEQFLGLSEPLSETYHTTHLTGVRKIGDSGPHIGAGRIKRNIDREVASEIQGYVGPAQEQFKRCKEALQRLNQY